MQPEEPDAPEAEEAPKDTLFDEINPDTLPEELQPLRKQLERAFYAKTTALAEQRRQIEELGDVESLQQAVELVQRIQNPDSWPQLAAELDEAMQKAGLKQPETPAPAVPPTADAPSLDDLDPELAPVKAELDALKSRLESFETERQQAIQAEQAEMQAERQRMAFLSEIQRQEDVIREANPHFKQEHIDAIYDLAPATGGNLLAAAERYSQIVSSAKAELFASKKSVAENKSVKPLPNGNGATPKGEAPKTIEEAADEAEEHIRQLMAAGEIDLSF